MVTLHPRVRMRLWAKWATCSGTWNLGLSYKAVSSSRKAVRWDFPLGTLGLNATLPASVES